MIQKKSLKGYQLINLKTALCKDSMDRTGESWGVLTDTLEVVSGHRRLLRSLSWQDDDYEHVLTVLKDIIDASEDNLTLVLE